MVRCGRVRALDDAGNDLAHRAMWRCSSFMSVRPESGLSWSQQFPSLGGVDVQFRCRLFRLVRASVFGVPVGFLVLCCWPHVSCLVDLAALPPAVLVLTIAGASEDWVGAVLSWSDFQASGGCRGCWVSGSSLVLFWDVLLTLVPIRWLVRLGFVFVKFLFRLRSLFGASAMGR